MAINKKIYALILIVLVPLMAQAQRGVLKPRWVTSQPKSLNSTYEFKSFWVQSQSISSAKQSLPKEAAYYMERTFGVEGVHIKVVNEDISYKNSQISNNTNIKVIDSVRTTNDKVNVKLRVIDEYQSGRDCYFLCAVPNPNARAVTYDSFILTDKYGVNGFWRSAIVPGWGQFHKHHYLKGGLILGGCVALAGGIVFTEVTRSDYAKKIKTTHDVKAKQEYVNRMNHFALARNICIGATAALYVYNLIDAIAMPGARYIKIKKQDKNGRLYSFAPSVTNEGMPIAYASITF